MSSGIPIQPHHAENGLSRKCHGTTINIDGLCNTGIIQPHVQPFKQGILDSLCGLYVWINAVHYLIGELSQSQAIDLFHQMTSWLSRKGLLTEVVQDGMDDRLLLRLHKWHIAKYQHPSRECSNFTQRSKHNINRQGVIRTRPLEFCVFENSVHLQSHLRDCPLLSDGSGLLQLNFLDREDGSEHLTLAWHCDDDYLYLLDSSEWEVLNWKDVRVPTERSRQARKKRYTVYPRYMRWLSIGDLI